MRATVTGLIEVPILKKLAVAGYTQSRKKGEGKAGASRRGKTSPSSVQDYY